MSVFGGKERGAAARRPAELRAWARGAQQAVDAEQASSATQAPAQGATRKAAAMLLAAALALLCVAAVLAPMDDAAAGGDDAVWGVAVALADESDEDEDADSGELEDAEALDADNNEVDPTQLPDSSFVYETAIEDLDTADSYYDEQTVQVVGEVIGDMLNANASGSYVWISLSSQDSDAVISVYMNSEAASKIDTFGAYGSTGTILQVRGTFHLACDEHDGETDLHAEVVTIVARGIEEEDEFAFSDFLPGIVAVGLGLGLLAVFMVLRNRTR